MIPCTFRQLEIFLAAAEDCHFVRTANRLGISQPAVTHHIRTLEKQLGKQLFVRRRGATPVLSTDGLSFLAQARRLMEEGEKLTGGAAASPKKAQALVRVIAGRHILEDCIKPRLAEFYDEAPAIEVVCTTGDSVQEGVRAVRSGAAEMCVFAVRSADTFGLRAEVLRTIRFGLYASPAFAGRVSATPEELSQLPFVLPPEGSVQDQAIQEGLSERGVVACNVAMRAQYSEVILDLARKGVGVAALFDTMVKEPVARGELVKFEIELPRRRRTLFRQKGVPTEPIARVESFLRRIL